MIDAAIVGLGRWGKVLVEAVEGKSERLRFTCAVSRNPDRLRDYAAEHRLELVSEFQSVLADPSIDAIVLATPHSAHCEQIVAAAAAGKAVFCEKPLALKKAEAAGAIEACDKAGVVLGVGTDKRFFPSWSELVRLVKTGELGDVLHIEAHFSNEVAGTFTTLAAVRSTPLYLRLHAFGRHTSAEAVSRTELVLRRSGAEEQRLTFSAVDTVRANLEAFADAVVGRAQYPIPPNQMLDTVAAFEAIAEAVRSHRQFREV
jgi:predicted dehydrogenase